MLTRRRTLGSLLDAAGQPDWLLCRAVTQLPTLDESPETHRSLISPLSPLLGHFSPPLSLSLIPGCSFPTNRSPPVGTLYWPITVLSGVIGMCAMCRTQMCCPPVDVVVLYGTAECGPRMGRNQRGVEAHTCTAAMQASSAAI